MKYFTAYIPINKEIEVGDIVKRKDGRAFRLISNQKLNRPQTYATTKIELLIHREYKVVKLFLCSKDFKIGDTITWTDGRTTNDPGIITDEQDIGIVETNPDAAFKVIGEISSEALSYCKEGMEYDKEDVKFIADCTMPYEHDDYREITEKQYLSKRKVHTFETKELREIRIKGPCNHYH